MFEETIGAYGPSGDRLLTRLLEVDGGRPHRMTGDDLVHTDYSPGNVLFDDAGQVSGVVDWNFGVARGDRHYALIGLQWGSVGARTIKPQEMAYIEAAVSELGPVLRSRYEAHWATYQVHRSIIERFPVDRIESDLAFAAEVMG